MQHNVKIDLPVHNVISCLNLNEISSDLSQDRDACIKIVSLYSSLLSSFHLLANADVKLRVLLSGNNTKVVFTYYELVLIVSTILKPYKPTSSAGLSHPVLSHAHSDYLEPSNEVCNCQWSSFSCELDRRSFRRVCDAYNRLKQC